MVMVTKVLTACNGQISVELYYFRFELYYIITILYPDHFYLGSYQSQIVGHNLNWKRILLQ